MMRKVNRGVGVALLLLGAGEARAASDPHIAVDPRGTAHFAWLRDDIPSQPLVQDRRLKSSGTLTDIEYIARPRPVVSFDGNSHPRVAVDPAGNAYYVWVSGLSLEGRARKADGTLGPVQLLASFFEGSVDDPRLAVDGDGDAYITWSASVAGIRVVRARHRRADGTLGAVQDLSANGRDADSQQTAVNSNGHAALTWDGADDESNRAVYAASGFQDTFVPQGIISPPGQTSIDPQVAIDRHGNAHFTWQRFNGIQWIVQTIRRSPQGGFGTPQSISAAGEDARDPRVAVDPARNAYFTWRRYNGTNWIVQARRRRGDDTFSTTQPLSAPGQDTLDPGLAVDKKSNAYFTWTRFDGSNWIAQARRLDADGSYGPIRDLSAPGQDASLPGVAVDSAGNATFVWERAGVIQTRRWTAAGALGPALNLSN